MLSTYVRKSTVNTQSSHLAEAKAAEDAGLNVAVVVRPGNMELTEEERNHYRTLSTFSQLELAGSA